MIYILTILRVKRTEEENMGRYSMSIIAFKNEKDVHPEMEFLKKYEDPNANTTYYRTEWEIEEKLDTRYLYVAVVLINTDVEDKKRLDIISADTDAEVVEKKLAEFQAANKDDVFMTARLKGLFIK